MWLTDPALNSTQVENTEKLLDKRIIQRNQMFLYFLPGIKEGEKN